MTTKDSALANGILAPSMQTQDGRKGTIVSILQPDLLAKPNIWYPSTVESDIADHCCSKCNPEDGG